MRDMYYFVSLNHVMLIEVDQTKNEKLLLIKRAKARDLLQRHQTNLSLGLRGPQATIINLLALGILFIELVHLLLCNASTSQKYFINCRRHIS